MWVNKDFFCFSMRNYKRKSDRGTKSVELMQRAADLVINENKSLRQVIPRHVDYVNLLKLIIKEEFNFCVTVKEVYFVFYVKSF